MNTAVWYALAAMILGWTGFSVYRYIKNRKKGGCGGGCGSCPYGGSCRRKK